MTSDPLRGSGGPQLTLRGRGRNPEAASRDTSTALAIHLYQSDLPDGLTLGPVVAIDTETMGLDPRRDRLCVVRLSDGSGDAHLVQIAKGQTGAPNWSGFWPTPTR